MLLTTQNVKKKFIFNKVVNRNIRCRLATFIVATIWIAFLISTCSINCQKKLLAKGIKRWAVPSWCWIWKLKTQSCLMINRHLYMKICSYCPSNLLGITNSLSAHFIFSLQHHLWNTHLTKARISTGLIYSHIYTNVPFNAEEYVERNSCLTIRLQLEFLRKPKTYFSVK